MLGVLFVDYSALIAVLGRALSASYAPFRLASAFSHFRYWVTWPCPSSAAIGFRSDAQTRVVIVLSEE